MEIEKLARQFGLRGFHYGGSFGSSFHGYPAAGGIVHATLGIFGESGFSDRNVAVATGGLPKAPRAHPQREN
jgi:hypothetical protein